MLMRYKAVTMGKSQVPVKTRIERPSVKTPAFEIVDIYIYIYIKILSVKKFNYGK